jgi:hypothetical protein
LIKRAVCLSVFKTTAIGLDEFNGVDDHFEAAAVLALIGFPFGLLQITNNSDTGTGMEILFSDLGILVEANTHFIQPVFSRPDLNARENDETGSPSDPKKISGSLPRFAGQNELIDHCSIFVKEYGAYTGRNPKTGEKVKIKPKKLPFFKAGKELKERVDR